jgi:epoxyqueuosine reductase
MSLRGDLHPPPLDIALFNWTEEAFLKNTEGSAIRRVGYEGWLRNIAVALGNAPASPEAVAALEQRRAHPSALVREHVTWALTRHAAEARRAGSKY